MILIIASGGLWAEQAKGPHPSRLLSVRFWHIACSVKLSSDGWQADIERATGLSNLLTQEYL